jgi:hypothetical protein
MSKRENGAQGTSFKRSEHALVGGFLFTLEIFQQESEQI